LNYLGHAVLSMHNPAILAGNMIGDYVKGSQVIDTFPITIQVGIRLHRKIDYFSDNHHATAKAKNLFRNDYGLYSGAMVDVVYDHFLANDPQYFPKEAKLSEFAQEVYTQLMSQEQHLPEKFKSILPYMVSNNWLYNYRTLKGMQKAFEGLTRKALYIEHSEKAYETLVGHYYQLNQLYYDFMDDIYAYVKNELNELGADN
jgi:acyl carrier protein phosphodiesterase